MSNVVQFPIRQVQPKQSDESIVYLDDLMDPEEMAHERANNAIASLLMSLDEDGVDTDHPEIHDLILEMHDTIYQALRRIR
jgi:hypothetical protein